jgi:hypothetical protein
LSTISVILPAPEFNSPKVSCSLTAADLGE